MKLGQLNAAIRGTKTVLLVAPWGGPVAVQKTALLESLKAAYTDGKAQETWLHLVDGVVCFETEAPPMAPGATEEDPTPLPVEEVEVAPDEDDFYGDLL